MYPDDIYVPRAVVDRDGVVYDAAKTKILFAKDLNDANDNIEAIEEVLGTNPEGGFVTFQDRLNSYDRTYINFIIDGGGQAITTGLKGFVVIPWQMQIVSVRLLADQTGSIKIDLWKDTYANFPPTDADTICGANEPEIASGIKDEDTVLTNWTKVLNAGDILAFNVDSVATIQRVTVAILCDRNY